MCPNPPFFDKSTRNIEKQPVFSHFLAASSGCRSANAHSLNVRGYFLTVSGDFLDVNPDFLTGSGDFFDANTDFPTVGGVRVTVSGDFSDVNSDCLKVNTLGAVLRDRQLFLDAELLHALAQRGAGDAQQLRGVNLIAGGFLQRVDDQLALDRRDDFPRRLAPRPAE